MYPARSKADPSGRKDDVGRDPNKRQIITKDVRVHMISIL